MPGAGGTKKTGAGGATKTTGAGGSIKTGAGGATGTAGRGTGTGTTGAGGKVTTSGSGPRIPEITETCPEFVNGSITFMGVSGINIAAGPKAAGPTAPMLFYWHGTGSTNVEYAMMDSAISGGVTSEGGVIVSFQSLSGSGDSSCSGTFIFDTGSFLMTDQLFACAVKNHNVDPKRVYVAGCSAGGLFSACMGAYRSSYVAAVVPNSGGFVFPQPFEDDHTPSLMTRHGAPGTDVVVIDFSTTSATADATFKQRGAFVVNCNHGGMHCGGSVLTAQGWEFMQAHPFGVSPEPWTALPAGWPAGCSIYQ
jgi:predicted esterase